MGSMMEKALGFMGFEVGEEEEEEYVEPIKEEKNEKVLKFNDIKSRKPGHFESMEIEHILLAPEKFADAERIADEIKNKKIITLNMGGVTLDIARRILDFISGTAYAIDAKIIKVNNEVFTIDPVRVKQINELPIRESSNEIMDRRDARNNEEIIRKVAR